MGDLACASDLLAELVVVVMTVLREGVDVLLRRMRQAKAGVVYPAPSDAQSPAAAAQTNFASLYSLATVVSVARFCLAMAYQLRISSLQFLSLQWAKASW